MRIFLKKTFLFLFTFSLGVIILILIFKNILISNIEFKSTSFTSEILIFGDSQTECDIDDSIIKGSMNLSHSGDPIFFSYVKLKRLLTLREAPEIVVLGFSPNNLFSKGFYEHPKMKSLLRNYFFLMEMEDLKDVFIYNTLGGFKGLISTLFYSPRRDVFWTKKDIRDVEIGGYLKLPATNNDQLRKDIIDQRTYSGISPDRISTFYLQRIIKLCQENKIKLILLNTPIHKSLRFKQKVWKKNYDEFINSQNLNSIYWDLSDFENDDQQFYDENHLNHNGARVFSEFINHKLQNLHGSN